MRAVLTSVTMMLAMVKGPGDAVPDAAAARAPGTDEPWGALAEGSAREGGRERVFPIGGAHVYGDGFGDRPNHRGQDLLADCGTPLRAASDASVRLADEDGAAGRYVILRTTDGRDIVYMHLSDVDVRGGESVRAGDRVGTVGRTGNATTCHLHLETWSAPGWYAGGEPRDPSAMLRARERSDAGGAA